MNIELLSSSTYTSSLLILASVIIIKFIITSIRKDNSNNIFSLYCHQLALKVNRPTNTKSQQKVAGWLALLMSLSIIIIFLWLFEIFIEVIWLWEAVLLYFSVGNFKGLKLGNSLIKQLNNQNNAQAKEELQPLVLRECQQLSQLGLTKACIEMQLLKFTQLWLVPSLIFVLISPLTALAFKVILTMHYQWNIKEKNFENFGYAAALLVNLIQWLPSKLLGIAFLFTHANSHFLLHWRLAWADIFTLNNNFLLHTFSLINSIQLSGVAIYQGFKVRKKAFNTKARQPEIKDIKAANIKLTIAVIVLAIVFCLPLLKTFI